MSEQLDNFKPKINRVDIKDVKSLDELKINKVLGEGAFGVVSMFTHNGKKFALKVIDKDKIIKQLKGDEDAYNQMRDREIKMSRMVFNIQYSTKFYSHFE